MLKFETISIELKDINKLLEDNQIAELIKKIDQEVREQTHAKKPSDKQVLNAIKRYLNESEKKARPILSCWTPFDGDRVAFTNSYSLFVLNKKTLPFKVAFDNNYSEDAQKEFLEKNNISKNDVMMGCYPNLKNVIPDENDKKDILKVNINSFLAWYKVQDKTGIKRKDVIYNLGDDLFPYYVDPKLLKEMITILQLTDTIEFEFHGDFKPCVYRNNNQIGLLLPIKKY